MKTVLFVGTSLVLLFGGGAVHANNEAGRNAATLAGRLKQSSTATVSSRDGRSIAARGRFGAIIVTTDHVEGGDGHTIRTFSARKLDAHGLPSRLDTHAFGSDGTHLAQLGPAAHPGPKRALTSIIRTNEDGTPSMYLEP